MREKRGTNKNNLGDIQFHISVYMLFVVLKGLATETIVILWRVTGAD